MRLTEATAGTVLLPTTNEWIFYLPLQDSIMLSNPGGDVTK